MTVGEALAEARYRAGLSVDELSERTRIREAVIRCIEQDDYDACGGDLYVRGYVRAIAGAVGIDAQPLIREYDLAHTDPPEPRPESAPPTAAAPADAQAADNSTAVTRPEPILAAVTSADPAVTTADPAATAADLAVTAASPAVTPAAPEASAWGARFRGRRRAAGIAAVVVLVLAAAGVTGAVLASGSRHAPGGDVSAAAAQQAQRGAGTGTKQGSASSANTSNNAAQQSAGAAAAPAASTAPKPGETSKAGGGKAATRPSAKPAVPVRALPIALATAFGPDGVADGDNPQGALFPITPGSPLPWRSQWYATANFGLLKQGTGLLIDMGKQVTITSIRIDLAPYRGANLQLRVGTVAALPDLSMAARASGVGGTVRLALRSPQRARYLLIWFTLLPPNGVGQYQASVYRIVVNGRS